MRISSEMAIRWRNLYAEAAVSFEQSIDYLESYASAYPSKDVIPVQYVSEDLEIFSAFTVEKRLARGVLGTCPILSNRAPTEREWEEFLSHLLCELESVDGIFFSLVYPEILTLTHLLTVLDVHLGERLPSPLLDWSRKGKDLWPRVQGRLGKVAERRKRKIERLGLRIEEQYGGVAIESLQAIEQRSWKSVCGQDMFSRNQFEFYSTLLRRQLVRFLVLLDGTVPVAYRIDTQVGERVYCIKWSFDERYKSCSPGFYLLTVGLVATYGSSSVGLIDLFGSPDLLKDALETGRSARVDIAWPGSIVDLEALRERQQHDKRIREAYEGRLGLREIYQRN